MNAILGHFIPAILQHPKGNGAWWGEALNDRNGSISGGPPDIPLVWWQRGLGMREARLLIRKR
jgi:hypothetical protein